MRIIILVISLMTLDAYAATTKVPNGALTSNSTCAQKVDVTVVSEQDVSVYCDVAVKLEIAFMKPGELEVYNRIQYALLLATSEREKPGNSTDIKLRDAEYYLHGLYASTAKDFWHTTFTLGAPAYVALKFAAIKLKDSGYPWLEKKMRTDKDQPMSPSGGWEWAYKGFIDGTKIDGSKSTKGLLKVDGKNLIDGFPTFSWMNKAPSPPSPPRDFRVVD